MFMGHLEQLNILYFRWKKEFPNSIEHLINTSASSRQYFRIYADVETFIGVFNSDIKENKAFFHFTDIFRTGDFHVPKLFIIDKSEKYYLIEDLGDINLLGLLKSEGESLNISILYKKALEQLIRIQLYGSEHINFKKFAYPRAEFDSQSVLWDLNYFKYYFLKVVDISFDEQLLENDFHYLAKEVTNQKCIAFMFRDFQARNIHVRADKVWLIDYQGGRKGPMLYDLASILFQASAQLSLEFREELKTLYFNLLSKRFSISRSEFEQELNSMVFIRIIQTLGTYGFRGMIEKKSYFIESIPFALENLKAILDSPYFSLEIPYFAKLLKQLLELKSKFVLNN